MSEASRIIDLYQRKARDWAESRARGNLFERPWLDRFRALLSDEDWGRLPLATWRRFSKRVADGMLQRVAAHRSRSAFITRRSSCSSQAFSRQMA